jgi:molybdopterin converting factor subunit 1
VVVVIHLFAVARQLAGTPSVDIEISEHGTVEMLRTALAEAIPALREALPRLRIAVDSEYVDDSFMLRPGAEVAIIPPVSGGSID